MLFYQIWGNILYNNQDENRSTYNLNKIIKVLNKHDRINQSTKITNMYTHILMQNIKELIKIYLSISMHANHGRMIN